MTGPPLKEPTLVRNFRFTASEIARIDALGRTLAEPGIKVSRIAVLRLALARLEADQLKKPARR